MGGTGQVTLVTPWYPTEEKRYGGAFVREWLRALRAPADSTTVVHLEMVEPGDLRESAESPTPEGRVIWVPVKVGDHLPRADAARAQLAAATKAAREAVEGADVVFAHVALPTGWAAARLARPGQRFILAEHASYVPQLLARADSRALFAEAAGRADAILAAGEATAELVRRELPAVRPKTWAVGNPLDADAFPFLDHPFGGTFRRWLYVGNLHASKGVAAAVRTLAAYAPVEPEARLALAGQGVAEAGLRRLAERLGVADRVDFLGGQDRAGVVAAMARADLMVHLSPGETFGIAPLEGLVSGLPLLVARNAGTLQTMGPALAAGRAAMVDAPRLDSGGGRRDARRAAQALVVLGRRLGQAGPDGALALRERIAARYGFEAFGELERRVARGLGPYPAPTGDRRPLVVAAATRAAWDQGQEALRTALWEGRPVVVAVASARIAAGADSRVQVEVLDPGAGSLDAALAGAARLGTRGLWFAGAAPLRVWRLGLGLARRLARRMPQAVEARLAAWADAAGRRASRWNAFTRSSVEPALARAALTRQGARAWAAAARGAAPDGAEILAQPADGPRLAAGIRSGGSGGALS
ncbi:MAG: glycosyltransferase [Bifidobacteriaceae bacterium]|jgi:glycosyltransferase involved in cell wall biosynthesis|nr:glycosyltransferase [Bifidobacteriaceae bacterium]